ncbi:hypothetical protein L2K20_07415 [Mycobacterium sp. MBM]|nr:hypothetical protein [Mycobacterium sp. MBM]
MQQKLSRRAGRRAPILIDSKCDLDIGGRFIQFADTAHNFRMRKLRAMSVHCELTSLKQVAIARRRHAIDLRPSLISMPKDVVQLVFRNRTGCYVVSRLFASHRID